ncbi:unnamed protein product [Nezara viridula]|uniref:Uncharacterized protein n=1 Tax=Nezara viridula TaxID=85310 RepID=A0A9P0MUK3_NEZVI|nr:unnamed protein product [Nezara viridula]
MSITALSRSSHINYLGDVVVPPVFLCPPASRSQALLSSSPHLVILLAGEVEREKKNTYDKCIPFLKEKFRETFGEREFTVRGLWFGSRGTIPKRTRSFLEELVDNFPESSSNEGKILDLDENKCRLFKLVRNKEVHRPGKREKQDGHFPSWELEEVAASRDGKCTVLMVH